MTAPKFGESQVNIEYRKSQITLAETHKAKTLEREVLGQENLGWN